jgi:hypothetical protein
MHHWGGFGDWISLIGTPASITSGRLDCGESRSSHDLLLHQANEQHVGLIEVAGLLGVAAQFFIHAQTLGQKGAPFVGLIFDRFDFKTSAARLVHKAGGSLRDVQLLAGHRSIQTTQGYIDCDSDVRRKLVAMI